jgi:hypothetical protein
MKPTLYHPVNTTSGLETQLIFGFRKKPRTRPSIFSNQSSNFEENWITKKFLNSERDPEIRVYKFHFLLLNTMVVFSYNEINLFQTNQ